MPSNSASPKASLLHLAYSKVARAESHIKNLNSEIEKFFGSNPYRVVPNVNENHTDVVWKIQVDPIPDAIECIAADAVHNLRTPLDKALACQFRDPIIHEKSAVISRLKFPIGNSLKEFRAILSRLEKDLTGPVIKFLGDTEAYDGGNGHLLWALNTLDNRDKHRSLTEPMKAALQDIQIGKIGVTGGFLVRLGSRHGAHLVPTPDAVPGKWDLYQPRENLRPVWRAPIPPNRHGSLEFRSSHDDMEVFTTTANAKVYANVQPTLNIAFSNVRGLEGKPIIQALEAIREAVLLVLDEFEHRFLLGAHGSSREKLD